LQSVAKAAQQSVAAAVAQADALSLAHRGDEIRVVVSAATAAAGLAAVHASGGEIEATNGAEVQAFVSPRGQLLNQSPELRNC